MVTKVWEISQAYEVFRGVCRFCAIDRDLNSPNTKYRSMRGSEIDIIQVEVGR